jgi:hypothetical protein
MAWSADGIPLQIRAGFHPFYPRNCLAAGGLNFFAQKTVFIHGIRD